MCGVLVRESGEEETVLRKGREGLTEEAEGDTAAVWAGNGYRPLQVRTGVPVLLSIVASVAPGSLAASYPDYLGYVSVT